MKDHLDTIIKALPESDKYVIYIDLDKTDVAEAYEWAKQVEHKLGADKLILLPYSVQLDRINRDMLKAWIDLATEEWEKMNK